MSCRYRRGRQNRKRRELEFKRSREKAIREAREAAGSEQAHCDRCGMAMEMHDMMGILLQSVGYLLGTDNKVEKICTACYASEESRKQREARREK